MMGPRRAFFDAVNAGLRWRRGFRHVGRERLEALEGPAILACNHAHTWDSVYVICATRRRLTVCGARPVYFSTARKRALMGLLRVIEVAERDRYLNDCAALLARGESLLVYPEMCRNPGGMGSFRDWAAEVALASGHPVVPLYIRGTTEGHDPQQIRLHYGRPLRPRPGEDAAALTQRIRAAIEALAALPPTQGRAS